MTIYTERLAVLLYDAAIEAGLDHPSAPYDAPRYTLMAARLLTRLLDIPPTSPHIEAPTQREPTPHAHSYRLPNNP
jgi:hypothetical protein